jgi:hypothetical protein
MKKIILLVALLLIAFLLITSGLFFYQERRRVSLIENYEKNATYIFSLDLRNETKANALFKAEEILVCALSSYSSSNSIVALNEKQKQSLPKTDLPSQDLSWYLLFFKVDSISRIALISDEKFLFANESKVQCIGGNDELIVDQINHSIKFIKKGN